MAMTPIRKSLLPASRDCGAARKHRSPVGLQVLILAFAASAWLCGSPGLVSEVRAGGGGLGSPNPITYDYDSLGRLIAVIDGSGNWVSYQYDAVGNVVSIQTGTSSTVEIFNISPNNGPVGASVTINGNGFSTTAGQNTVTFGGQAATVTASSQTTISTTVPANVATGTVTVSVTAPAGSASASFTVTAQ